MRTWGLEGWCLATTILKIFSACVGRELDGLALGYGGTWIREWVLVWIERSGVGLLVYWKTAAECGVMGSFGLFVMLDYHWVGEQNVRSSWAGRANTIQISMMDRWIGGMAVGYLYELNICL